ncbi:hypothetical protein OG21DRAFT_1527782 [Imleria badia]|nr:hypothetical protein OG21DRAFT_1527782 [Imleria badia]
MDGIAKGLLTTVRNPDTILECQDPWELDWDDFYVYMNVDELIWCSKYKGTINGKTLWTILPPTSATKASTGAPEKKGEEGDDASVATPGSPAPDNVPMHPATAAPIPLPVPIPAGSTLIKGLGSLDGVAEYM